MKKSVILSLLCLFICSALPCNAQESRDLKTESAPTSATIEESPLPAWEGLPSSNEDQPWYLTAFWYLPNRFLDFVDIFRVDVGIGGGFGGVARISRYGQVGYRSIAPASLRVGDFGRKLPVMVERSSEFGVGPAFFESKDRDICASEIGLGADLIIGAYAGICAAEIFDFIGGIFLVDISKDDLR